MAKRKNGARVRAKRREGDALIDALDELLRYMRRQPVSVDWLASVFENTPRTIRSWVTMLRQNGEVIYSSTDEGVLCYFIPEKEARL